MEDMEIYTADNEQTAPEVDRELETGKMLRLFEYAESYRKSFEPDNLEYYRQYVGYKEISENKSSLHIPRTYELIDNLRSRIVLALTQTRPYIEFEVMYKNPNELQNWENAEQKAELAAGLLDNQLEKNCFENKAYQFVSDYLVFQAAIMGVGWRLESRMVRKRKPVAMTLEPGSIDPRTGVPVMTPTQIEIPGQFEDVQEEEMTWDDNELQNIDFFDFWPDPRAQGCDVDQCRFVFHREWMTWEDLSDYLELLEGSSDGTVYELNKEEIDKTSGETESGAWQKLSAVGQSYETGDAADDDTNHLRLYEILHYWEDGKHGVLVNRHSLAYVGANPYWRHGKKPFVACCYEQLSGQFYGNSAVQKLQHLQAELDTIRNQRIDNVSMIINRMWKRLRGADIDDSQLISRPNGIIDVDNMDAIQPLETLDVTASAYQEEQIIKMDMENALPTPPVSRGMGEEKTATSTAINNENATTRWNIKIKLFEGLGIKRMARLMDLNNQQFIDEPRLVKFAEQDGATAWRMVDVGDILGEHDYRPACAGIDPALNKDIRRQQLIQLYPIASQDRYIDQYKFRKLLYESFDKDYLELIRPEEEVQAEMQQEQMIMAMQQQMAMNQARQQEEQHGMSLANQGVGLAEKIIGLGESGEPAEGGGFG